MREVQRASPEEPPRGGVSKGDTRHGCAAALLRMRMSFDAIYKAPSS